MRNLHESMQEAIQNVVGTIKSISFMFLKCLSTSKTQTTIFKGWEDMQGVQFSEPTGEK